MIELIHIYGTAWTGIMLHELGHFIVANWFFRFPIARVRIGHGWPMRFIWRGVSFHIGLIPDTGRVSLFVWGKIKRPWRYFMFQAAGPLASFGYALWLAIHGNVALSYIPLMQFLINILPGFSAHNDGAQMLYTWRTGDVPRYKEP